MNIEIRGIPGNRLLQAYVREQVSAALARRHVAAADARVLFFDENGPKGGVDIRCAVTLRAPFRPPVRAEHMGASYRRAFDEAFAVFERQLERAVGRARDSRRHPKKYYMARRLLDGARDRQAM